MGASRSPTAERRSAPAHPRRRPSPARAGWGGRPMRSTWASPSGPTCRWKRAMIRTPRPRRPASIKPIKIALPRTRAGVPFLQRRRVPATRRTTSRMRREAARIVYLHGLWLAALAIWGRDAGAASRAVKPEDARWRNGALAVEGLQPLPLARLAQEAHARGFVVGAAVHAFNRWQWAEADFVWDGASTRAAVDALSVRYGDGAGAAKQALATTPNRYHVLDRRSVFFPPTQNSNAMVGYNTVAGTLAELVVDAANGKVMLLSHHTILECGNMLVPELVSGQVQGATATGIGLALHEWLPLYEDGPGDGTWNFNRYHLPRGSDVAVWAQTAEVLPPLSDDEPPKGMAEVAGIPIMPAIVNGIAHAIGHRFRTLPVTPDRILEVLA